MMLWQDLQELFYIALGPFVFYLLLPAFVGGGITLAIFYTVYDYLVELFDSNTSQLEAGSGGGMFSGRSKEGIFFTAKPLKKRR